MLWIILFGSVIAGFISGWNIWNIGGAIIGGIIGLLIGFFIVIIGGGLIATFLNLDENIQYISNDLNELIKNVKNNGISNNIQIMDEKTIKKTIVREHLVRCDNCGKMINADIIECPYCKEKKP